MEYNNDNNKQQTNVNTRGAVFMNSDSVINKSTLVTGFWNNMLSLKIHPMLPEEKQTDFRKFDYDEAVTTAVTESKTATLLFIAKQAAEALENKTDYARGVSVGGNGLISINVIAENIERPYVYLQIARDIDEVTRQSKNFNIYIFKDELTIDNYDTKTGKFTAGEPIHAEFLRFVNVLEASVYALTNAATHSYRHVEKFYKDKLMNLVSSIADKNGIDTGSAFQRKGGSQGGSGSFWAEQKDTREKMKVEHSNQEELKDLM